MKKIFTFFMVGAFVLLASDTFAQNPRMTFVEEATQASCPPCAAANPPLQALLNDNHDEAIFVAYQVWWPGYDAMYLDNEAEVDERIGNYYSDVTGAPNIVVQGNSGAQATTYLTQDLIDNTYAEESEFMITLNAEILNGSLEITGGLEAAAAASGDLRLRLIITEDVIYGTDLIQEGTNGETEFHHVFKKFVNGPEGITLASDWAMGDTYEINESFNLSSLNIYDYSGIEVVAIVQNDDDKFVHQAAKASELEITVDNDQSVAAAGLESIPAQCSGEITIEPVVTISNSGNNALESAMITYSVNGGAEQMYEWTGSITTFQSADVTLPAYTYTSTGSDVLNVNVGSPNGGTDEVLGDDDLSIDLPVSPDVENFLVLELDTDTYADEIYWEVQNSGGETVAWGGNPNVGLTNVGTGMFPPPADPNMYENSTSYTIGIDIPAIDCYTFYFADYYGDGVATYGGSYVVTDSQGNLLIDGTAFAGDLESSQYKGTAVGVGVEEVEADNDFTILANPISNQLDLVMNITQATSSSLVVLDSQGRTVVSENLGTLAAGQYNRSYDVSALSSGMYYVSLTTADKVVNKKVIVRK